MSPAAAPEPFAAQPGAAPAPAGAPPAAVQEPLAAAEAGGGPAGGSFLQGPRPVDLVEHESELFQRLTTQVGRLLNVGHELGERAIRPCLISVAK